MHQISSPYLQTMIDEADVDGDGQIDYSEFYDMMAAGIMWIVKLMFMLE